MASSWPLRPAQMTRSGRLERGLRHGISRRPIHLDHRARLSNVWVPPPQVVLKDAKADEESHAKLVRAGFLRQAHSGVFHLLPLGLRVQDKIEAVVDRHMREIGASRVSLSTFSSARLWDQTGRLASVQAELFQFADRKDARYLLSPTHEEEITELVRQNVHSYRSLPLRLYQITRKYRDEMRPRHGILRSREFLMKDLYTFDLTAEAALATYEDVRGAYARIFAALKVPVLVARASSGDMGGDLSHEYHLAASLGEDDVASCASCGYAANAELQVPSATTCPSCGGALTTQRAIELGHTFYLGTRYTAPLAVTVAGEAGGGAPVTPLMGCYGIGISRLLGAVADQRADARGLNWPRAMAPYEAVVVSGGGSESAAAEQVYDALTASPGLDALLDDRAHASLPWKLKDADLAGYPVVVVVGAAWKKSRAAGGRGVCEVQCRQLGVKQDVALAEVRAFVGELLERL